MAAFLQMTSWEGELTDAYFEQQPPEPETFGLPTADDGSRDDPLLGAGPTRSRHTSPTSGRWPLPRPRSWSASAGEFAATLREVPAAG